MKVTFDDQRKYKAKCATPKMEHAGRRQSVAVVANIPDQKCIPETSENDDFDLWDHNRGLGNAKRSPSSRVCWKPSCIPISIIGLLIVIVIVVPLTEFKDKLFTRRSSVMSPNVCRSSCKIQLAESIPEGIEFPDGSPGFMSTFDAWQHLIAIANKSIDIGSFYWSLRGDDFYNHTSAWQGEKIFENLLLAGTKRGIKIRVAQSQPSKAEPNLDTELLVKLKAAEVRSVDFRRLLGDGVLHTKLWIVDGQHFYVGSANMDWRSLTQVKELGTLITNCSCLVDDLSKIFNVYWDMGKDQAVIPPSWPKEYSTRINLSNPIAVNFNDTFKSKTYISSSPPPMSPNGRTQDIDAIVNAIQNAETFVHIAVMDYFPLTLYTPKTTYWPIIDDAIRKAAINRGVSVKLLISWWNHSRPAEDNFLESLLVLSGSYPTVDIQVRRFICTATEDQAKIPFARVNHNKYMVTDKEAYIGTSNWSADYFINTAGIGLVLEDSDNQRNRTIRRDLASVFERDWNSAYAVDLRKTMRF